MKRAAAFLLAAALAGADAPAGQTAVYRVLGQDARVFDQYDNDGYSMAVAGTGDGGLELTVRVSDAPLGSTAPWPIRVAGESPAPVAAPERDVFARRAVASCHTQEEAVRQLLLAVAGEVTYDPDRLRLQDPAAVFASRRAYCVGFADLAVDLLRRIGISARTVQGVLVCANECDGYEPAVGGAYHRWIEVYYPDRGYVFSDPSASVNGVDARYIPFDRRLLAKPQSLSVTTISTTGDLAYKILRAGTGLVRVRE